MASKLAGGKIAPKWEKLHMGTGAKIVPNSGTQAAAITAPTGGTTTDAEARTAINAIITALEGVGIVAAN